MEGYTARDALILMRLDLTESLHEIEQDISEMNETLEFSGIAEQLLKDDSSVVEFPAIKRWLEIVGNRSELENELQQLRDERQDLIRALEHLEERLTGRRLS